ncbi:tripartite motif-containing protein 44 [Stegastes partitus]|uniref:Tripartite motif-containing protein 44-like n=1 Tax=Stegastes partitus TaxID=144197 RepID=A0A3B4ZQB9_9TELE|nr:PREDICTED: tripartite motif-containing protein 44-like [Stegastes partitus]XP_008279986.1 PREDICTED: tripartite motif-containing protein 44-like [Stegastes partitus]
MDHQGEEPMGLKQEELPQMDGSCDACEPDEAQPATQVCHTCSFAFCPLHADRHASNTHHALMPYNCDGTQANGLGTNGDSRVGGEDEAGAEGAAGTGSNQATVPLGLAAAGGGESGNVEEGEAAQNPPPLEAELGGGAEGAEAMPAGEAGKKDSVTVERLRCKEHGQEGSLYCKPDEKIICVVCAVQGEHRGHEIITLYEAYVWQKSREGYDLLGCTQQMAENVKTKWTNPEMSTEELEEYVNRQFDELRKLVRLEEKRFLHLVDLKEAFLTASAAEKIAEITVETEKLQEEMANITHQLCLLEQAESQAPAVAVEALVAANRPANRALRDIEARPRLPEPRANPMNPRDLEDNDSGPSMDHAP